MACVSLAVGTRGRQLVGQMMLSDYLRTMDTASVTSITNSVWGHCLNWVSLTQKLRCMLTLIPRLGFTLDQP